MLCVKEKIIKIYINKIEIHTLQWIKYYSKTFWKRIKPSVNAMDSYFNFIIKKNTTIVKYIYK